MRLGISFREATPNHGHESTMISLRLQVCKHHSSFLEAAG
jgi:hypothetical protein